MPETLSAILSGGGVLHVSVVLFIPVSLPVFELVPYVAPPPSLWGPGSHTGWLLRRCPPLPIPNREVKPARADGTAQQCGRVGSRPLFLLQTVPRRELLAGDGFFCSLNPYLKSLLGTVLFFVRLLRMGAV